MINLPCKYRSTEPIGVVNCGCKGDLDTTLYACDSDDSGVEYCVIVDGKKPRTKKAKLTTGAEVQLMYRGCLKCPVILPKEATPREIKQEPPSRLKPYQKASWKPKGESKSDNRKTG